VIDLQRGDCVDTRINKPAKESSMRVERCPDDASLLMRRETGFFRWHRYEKNQ
jgi:hypothetical protein